MKKIFIIMILLTGLIYPQYTVKDSVVAHATAIAQHAQQILDLEVGVTSAGYTKFEIDQMLATINARLDAHDDSIASLRASIGYITPTFPDAPYSLVASSDGTNIDLIWGKYNMNNPPDSFAVFYSATSPLLGGVEGITLEYTTDTTSSLLAPTENTVYYFWVKAILDGNFSVASNVDTSLVYKAPTGGGGGSVEGENGWFVDNTATGANNGTSWADAWVELSSVNWGSIAAGDTLYISGGATSQTYTTTLSIGKSGAAGSPICVTKGLSSGYNGEVILRQSSSSFITNTSYSYIEIANLTIDGQDYTADDRPIDMGNSSGSFHDITFKSLNFSVIKSTEALKVGGSTATVKNIIVQDCYFRQDSLAGGVSRQTDCIYMQGVDSIYITGCTFISRNNITSPHSDGIQLNLCGDTWVEGNKFYHVNTKTAYNQVCYTTQNSGKFFLVNNIFYISAPNSTAPIISPSRIPIAMDSLYIINNTIVSQSSSSQKPWIEAVPHIVMYNNVLIEMTSTPNLFTIFTSNTDTKSDYNQTYPSKTNFCSYLGSSRSLTTWRALSGSDEHDENTTVSQPTFTNFDWNFNQWENVYEDVYDFSIPSRANGKTGITVWMGTHSFTTDGYVGSNQ